MYLIIGTVLIIIGCSMNLFVDSIPEAVILTMIIAGLGIAIIALSLCDLLNQKLRGDDHGNYIKRSEGN